VKKYSVKNPRITSTKLVKYPFTVHQSIIKPYINKIKNASDRKMVTFFETSHKKANAVF